MKLEKEFFEIEAFDTYFEGYLDQSDNGWNGWVNPYFTKEVAEEIYQEIIDSQKDWYKDEYVHELFFDEKNKSFTMFEKGDKNNVFDYCKMVEIDGMELYQVGNHNFCWDIFENDDENKHISLIDGKTYDVTSLRTYDGTREYDVVMIIDSNHEDEPIKVVDWYYGGYCYGNTEIGIQNYLDGKKIR